MYASIYCELNGEWGMRFYENITLAKEVMFALRRLKLATYAAMHMHDDWRRTIECVDEIKVVPFGQPVSYN